jgi:phage terminase large subunit-like protein
LSCERHIDDLKHGAERGLKWSLDHAHRIFGYFKDVLLLNGGQFEGLPFELRLWQAFIIGSVFGWLGSDGFRRFRTAYIEIGKGNGKSPMAGGVGLYCLTADNEARAEVYSAASTKDQAQILFRDAVAMRDQSPQLTRRIIKYGGLNPWNMFFPAHDSFFRTISSDDKQSGPRPHCALCDEVHEHPDGTVIDMLHAGFKFRRQPLAWEITNSGFDRNTVCYQHHEYSEKLLRRRLEDDAWFAYICSLDAGDDWKDPRVWIKANPNLGVSVTQKYLQEQVKKAEGMPVLQSKVRRLNFCEWVDADSPWIDGDAWRACESEEIDLSTYRGSRCWAGLDLSARNDLTALALVFIRPDGTGYDAFLFFWSPGENMRQREDRDRVPYTLWRDQGFLEVTPGATIEYSYVAQRIISFREQYGLDVLAFDRYRIEDLKSDLDDAGFEYTQLNMDAEDLDIEKANGLILANHGQGFKDMTPAVESITEVVSNKKLRVKRNPVLTMCSANAVVTSGASEEKKFDKRKSRGRIDGVVALAMAIKCAERFSSRDASGKSLFVEL